MFLHGWVKVVGIWLMASSACYAAQGSDVDDGLLTLKVVSDNARDGLRYVGTRFRVEDENDHPAPGLTCVSADAATLVVSGKLVADVDPSELDTLRRRIHSRAGGPFQLNALHPDHREARLKVGEEVVNLGSVSANLLEPIVIWGVLSKQGIANHRPVITVSMTWREQMLLSNLELQFDWATISKELILRMGESSTISLESLHSIAADVVKRRWVTSAKPADASETELRIPELIDLIATLMAKTLLSADPPTGKTSSSALPSYSLLDKDQRAKASTIIKLRESVEVDRLFEIHQEIPPCR